MKKYLGTDAIANELSGASLFFRPQAGAPSRAPSILAEQIQLALQPGPRVSSVSSSSTSSEATEQAPARTGRTGVPSVKRWMIRHPFEIYRDQLDALRILAVEDRLRRGAGSMSQMVCNALDQAITAGQGKDVAHQSETDGAHATNGQSGMDKSDNLT